MLTDHMTQATISKFIVDRIDTNALINKNIKLVDKTFRPDVRSEKYKFIVEFDGYRHYSSSSQIIVDEKRDAAFNDYGYQVIRLPYFVQLCAQVVARLFGKYCTNKEAFNNYPHGFHNPKALLPADFCHLGVKRFYDDLERFDYIALEILESLENACCRLGDRRLVFPV